MITQKTEKLEEQRFLMENPEFLAKEKSFCREQRNTNIIKEDMDVIMNSFKNEKTFTTYSRKSIKKHYHF